MLKLYITGIIFTTILAFVSFFLITNFISPDSADNFLLTLIYFSLFIGLSGIFAIIGYIIRRISQRNQMPLQRLSTSFRQGMWLGLILAGSLFLKTQKFYWWWSGLALLVLIVWLESAFLRRQR